MFSTRPAKALLNLGTGGWEPAAAPGHLRSQQRRVRDRGPAGGSSLKPHVAWATPASPGPSREMGRSRAERTGTGDYGDPAERSALGTGLPTVPVRMGHRNHRASETLGRPGRQQEGPSERSARAIARRGAARLLAVRRVAFYFLAVNYASRSRTAALATSGCRDAAPPRGLGSPLEAPGPGLEPLPLPTPGSGWRAPEKGGGRARGLSRALTTSPTPAPSLSRRLSGREAVP